MFCAVPKCNNKRGKRKNVAFIGTVASEFELKGKMFQGKVEWLQRKHVLILLIFLRLR